MTFLIDLSVKATLALGAAFLISFSRRASASIRYAAWTCALLALLILPLAMAIGPRWNVTMPSAESLAAPDRLVTSVIVNAKRQSPVLPQELPIILWLTGSAVMIAQILAGHWRLRALFGRAQEVTDPEWLALARDTAADLRITRKIALKQSTSADVPLSYGLLKSTVLLPADSSLWSCERRAIVVAHEMTHARRFDSLWGLIGQLARAMYWFHPLAWLAFSQLRKEQERSCDDAIVAAGTVNTTYAGHLVEVARSVTLPEGALSMAQKFDLEGRIRSLLDPLKNRKAASAKLCAAMLVAAVALIVPLAITHAQAPTALNGTVYDPSGAVVPHANLKLTSGSAEEATVADAAGQFRFPMIPAGQYQLRVQVPGFKEYPLTISIASGNPARVDVHLAVGEANESVSITAKRLAQPAPPQSSGAPQRIRVGGNVQAFRLLTRVTPLYPPDAQAEGVEGTVVLKAIISKEGRPISIKVVSDSVDKRLANAAITAVQSWFYEPARLNGEPIEVLTTIELSFKLN
jgi:TonB family protein